MPYDRIAEGLAALQRVSCHRILKREAIDSGLSRTVAAQAAVDALEVVDGGKIGTESLDEWLVRPGQVLETLASNTATPASRPTNGRAVDEDPAAGRLELAKQGRDVAPPFALIRTGAPRSRRSSAPSAGPPGLRPPAW